AWSRMIGRRTPIVSRTMLSVSSARESTEVYATWKRKPFSSSPARRASARPVSVSGTSTQPVKRFSRFQRDCPCRTRTRVGMGRASTQRPGIAQGSAPSLVIRPAAQDLEGPVQLLQDDDACQPVRQRQRREAPDELRLVADALSEALVASDAERERLGGIAQRRQPPRELLRGEQASALVEHPELSANLPEQRLRFAQGPLRAQLEEVQLCEAADPLRVLLRQLRGGSLVLAHRDEPDLHSTSMRGASAQSPSRS